MRYSIMILLYIFLFNFQNITVAQQYEFECSMPSSSGQSGQQVNYTGKFIPSIGTLRVIVVFVRFSGDNETSTNWPNATVLPSWAQNFVNPTFSQTGNYSPGLVSDYFYKNSYV